MVIMEIRDVRSVKALEVETGDIIKAPSRVFMIVGVITKSETTGFTSKGRFTLVNMKESCLPYQKDFTFSTPREAYDYMTKKHGEFELIKAENITLTLKGGK
jgi:hypothetical protein